MPSLARSTTRQRAAHDILLQVGVRILNLAIGVVVTALVVRTLGNSGYGQWSTILVVLGLISYFTTFGIQGIAVREAARDPEREHEWIGAVVMMRLLALGPVMVASIIAMVLLQRSQQMLVAGLILIVVMPFGGIGALGLLFQLRVDNRVPMLVLTLRSILWGGAVVVIFWTGGDMVALAIAMALTNAVGSLTQVLAVLRLDTRWPRPSRKHLRQLLRVGLPIGISGALIMAYGSIDQVIVFSIAGSKAAGLYGAVYNVLGQSSFVPISVLTTLAPVIAASWPGDRERLLRTARLTAELLAIASFGALAFVCVAATPLVNLIFGPEFVAAAPALPVLGGAFVLICFGYLNGNLLLVLGLQRRAMYISLFGLAFNLAGNLILVPIVGFMGAAWMTLATEAVVFALALTLVLRTLELPRPKLGRMGRTAVAAALLAGGLAALQLGGAPFVALVVAACVCYPALLFSLRAVALDDVRVLIGRGAPI